MARYVLPVVGAVVGAYFGNPQMGFMIGSMVGNIVDPQVIKGPSIGDGQTTTTQEGQARPIVWGSGVVGANIIDRGELVKKTKRTRQSKGGPVTENEHLYLTYAIRICEGPIQGVLRVWEDEKLVYDVRSAEDGGQVSAEDNGKYAESFRLYTGTESQMPDSALEAIHGVGNTPAYRGTAYIVFEGKDVTDRRGSIPNYRFEVVSGGGSFSTAGQFIFERIRAAEDDDGFTTTNNPELISTGGALDKRSLLTRDGRFILSGVGSGPGTVYEKGEDGEFYEVGTLPDVIQGWPAGAGASGSYSLDQDNSGKTIMLMYHWSNSIYTRNDLLLVKYDSSTGVFTCTDHILNTPSNSGGGGTIAMEPFGHWCVAASRNPGGFHRWFMTDAGQFFDYSFVSLDSLPNWASHLVIPFGEYAPPYTVLAFSSYYSHWVAHCYVGPTADDVPAITARDLDVDFPDVSFVGPGSNPNPFPPYYSESAGGWPKLVFFANTFDESTSTYAHKLLSYEIRGSIPTPPLQSLFPVVEYVGAPGSGSIAMTSGGVGKDITALSGGGVYGPPIDAPPGTSRFFKFVHNEDDTFTLDKWEDLQNGGSTGQVDDSWYLQLQYSENQGFSGDGISYRWFLEDVCTRSGLPLTNVDATDMTPYTIRGVVAASQYTGADVIQSTQPVFPMDVADYDKKLRFTRRGKPAVAAIVLGDMVNDSYEFTRQDALSYPKKLNLIYQHQRTGYVAAKATVERISPDVRVSGESSTTVPVVMDETQATQAADVLLKVSWTDAEGDVEFSITGEYDRLTVGDCVAIYPRSGQQYRMRIESIDRADGVLLVKGKIDRQSSYQSTVDALPVPDPTPPPPTFTGSSRLAYLDIPALTDADDSLLYYVAVNGSSPAWYGATTERRIEPDEFDTVASSGFGQAVGVLLDDLGSGPVDYTDTYNSVHLSMPGGESNAPVALTDEQLLRERNVLAICRPDGSAELLQFRDVEDLGNNTYRLSHLLRGRLYTGADAHGQGATVVLLDYGVSVVPVDAIDLGATWDHRAVSYGQDPDQALTRTDTYAARAQVEFPPGLLDGQVVADTLTLTWSHTYRFGGDTQPVDSLNRVGYYLEATDGVNSYTATIPATDQTATVDVSGWTGTVSVSLCGVNRYTGNGMQSTLEIEL